MITKCLQKREETIFVSFRIDDTTTFVSADSEEDAMRCMEEDANNVLTYMAINGLAANSSKTQVMVVGKKKIIDKCKIGSYNWSVRNETK